MNRVPIEDLLARRAPVHDRSSHRERVRGVPRPDPVRVADVPDHETVRRFGEGISTRAVAKELGVSYRRLHYWVTCGYIPGLRNTGSGTIWRWGDEQLAAAREVRDTFETARTAKRELRERAGLSATSS